MMRAQMDARMQSHALDAVGLTAQLLDQAPERNAPVYYLWHRQSHNSAADQRKCNQHGQWLC